MKQQFFLLLKNILKRRNYSMNYEKAKLTLKNYLIARIPFISINTIEKNRVVDMLREIHNESESSIYIHSMSKGMYDIKTNEMISNEKTLIGILTFISNEIK